MLTLSNLVPLLLHSVIRLVNDIKDVVLCCGYNGADPLGGDGHVVVDARLPWLTTAEASAGDPSQSPPT